MPQEPVFPRNRTQWFDDARFGMFIHWGLYSIPARGEWVLNREQIPREQYVKLADRFNPVDYDPRAWAALAVEAGMKYAVLTSKHHEGFCLWDSKVCPFNAVNSGANRDLLGEYVEAFRSAGLKVGLYYSLGDWYNDDWKRGFDGDDAARERFMDYTRDLVRELVTGYGPIDVLWYDLPQNYTAAEWRAVELNAMVRFHQPHIIINNRAMTTEDFGTPERHVRASGKGRMWEACLTLNESWGYCECDRDWKSPRDVVLLLTRVAGGGGNLLLNVGPDERGRINEPAPTILRRVGKWLKVHGESIYASRRHRMSWNLWGQSTARGNNLYVHLQRYFGPELTVAALTRRVIRVTLLTTGQELRFSQDDRRVRIAGLPAEPPDDVLPVVKLELDGPAAQDFGIGVADVEPEFPR